MLRDVSKWASAELSLVDPCRAFILQTQAGPSVDGLQLSFHMASTIGRSAGWSRPDLHTTGPGQTLKWWVPTKFSVGGPWTGFHTAGPERAIG